MSASVESIEPRPPRPCEVGRPKGGEGKTDANLTIFFSTCCAPLFGSPSGRPSGSLRGPRSWFSLFAHRHLHVISDSFSPQFGVQKNPRARDILQVKGSSLSALLAVWRPRHGLRTIIVASHTS